MAEQGGEKTAGAEAEKKERKSWGAESLTAAPAPAQAPPQHKNRAVLPHPNSPIPLPKARPGAASATLCLRLCVARDPFGGEVVRSMVGLVLEEGRGWWWIGG
eukprot:1664246-Rhodomonas_salina.2